MSESGDALVRDLRRQDSDRYLSTLYAPAQKRAALTALYLFDFEIAGIRERISQPLPGEIRLQWWRDTLAGGMQAAAGNPLAAALVATIAEHNLPASAFDRYLEARIFDLYDDPMPSRTDLEGYCGETASTVIQLAALVLEPATAPAFASAAGHAGCAQAIASLLRQMPLHRARGQCFVPSDILAAAGTDHQGFLSGRDAQAAGRAITAMVALGREHVARFETEAQGMPQALRPAFLPAALAPAWLDRVTARGFDPLKQMATLSPLRRHWILLSRATKGWR